MNLLATSRIFCVPGRMEFWLLRRGELYLVRNTWAELIVSELMDSLRVDLVVLTTYLGRFSFFPAGSTVIAVWNDQLLREMPLENFTITEHPSLRDGYMVQYKKPANKTEAKV